MKKSQGKVNDPFLITAGTDVGNMYRMKRAIIRLEQQEMENSATIRELKLENEKLRSKLNRLNEQAGLTDRVEQRFEQLSTIIMESKFMDVEEDEEEEEEISEN